MNDSPDRQPCQASQGRTLLVTGGGRGIGAAVARLAARQGWDVVVNVRQDIAAAEAVVSDVRACGRRGWLFPADVSDEQAVVNLFEKIDHEAGRLQGLVNNAGIVDRAQPVADMSLARWQRMFAVNVQGTFLCSREAVRRMALSRGGRGGAIVNLSSAAARLGSPGQYVDYAAAKAAIDTFTLGLAREVATQGIRVNAVRPGIIDTEIHASGGQPDRVRQMAPQVPMQRAGTADEVAQAVLWLLSDSSAYTTGSVVDVTGGR